MLNWSKQFNIFCLLDNNGYNHEVPAFDCILAAGCKRSLKPDSHNFLNSLRDFYNQKPCWLFGHFGYSLKNEIEELSSRHNDFIDFGKGFFFEPEILLTLQKNQLSISSETNNALEIFNAINKESAEILDESKQQLNIQSTISKEDYIKSIHALQQHIRRGDCYEINFCQQFFAKDVSINPLYTYCQLIQHSPNPFAALYKLNDRYCICASPERYLKKNGQTILSQPIKGTSKRNLLDNIKDEANKNYLRSNDKERSENVMVVDLVRNDLSKICKEGTVEVEELFGLYTFPQVHQMISTIKGEIAKGYDWTDIIKATFPMGSMTGAPKKRVMQLIDEYETCARGLFSGSIGYINPTADFDFNVVIRSIFYDATNQHLSFSAGGGITFKSIAEDEYNESLLKVGPILQILKGALL